MKTVELRSLANGNNKQIMIPPEIEKFYESWKEKRAGENLEPLEIFYAGYILANPMVRELFKKDKCELKN